jgi:hypothetical protein
MDRRHAADFVVVAEADDAVGITFGYSGREMPAEVPPIMPCGSRRDAWEVFLQAVMDGIHDLEPRAPTRRVLRPASPESRLRTMLDRAQRLRDKREEIGEPTHFRV